MRAPVAPKGWPNAKLPPWMLSLLVPLKESGALIPQWSVQQVLRRHLSSGVIWRSGMSVQGAMILVLALCLLWSAVWSAQTSGGTGAMLNVAYLALLAVIGLSIGRALCSFTIKDIQAHNVPKGARGDLIGRGGSIAGAVTIAVGLIIMWAQGSEVSKTVLLLCLLGAGVACYLAGLGLSVNLSMPPGQASKRTLRLWQFWSEERLLRRLVLQRLAVLHGALAMPYMVLLTIVDNSVSSLASLLLAAAFSSLIASWFWGKLSDVSVRLTMLRAVSVTLLGLIGFVLTYAEAWYWALLSFVLANLGYAGVRTARKTYLLDATTDEQRQQYVAAGNTLVGSGMLVIGGMYAVLYDMISHVADTGMLYICMFGLVVGGVLTLGLPKEK
jgi:hypothetical protein